MDEHGTGEPGQAQPYGAPQTFGQPSTAPSSHPYGAAPGPEVLDSSAPGWSVLPGYVGPDAPAPSRRRRTAAVAAVVVGALLVCGGAYAAWSRLNGSGPQPSDVLPASTVAIAEVDLDPSAGQKLALLDLLRKFPDAAGLQDSDKTFGDWLVRKLSESGSSTDTLDFAKDVEPWLGKRFAVAAVPAPAGSGTSGSRVDAVLVVQETDQAAATAAMDKARAHGDKLGYAFLDGYLVVTPDSATGASRVVSDAQKATLSDSGDFGSDVASLGSDEVVTAWVDAGRATQLVKDQMGSLGGDVAGLGGLSPLGGGLGGPFGASQGRVVLGVHATTDSVEMRVRTFGGAASTAAAPVRLQHVVADPIAVVAVSGAGANIAKSWKALASSPMYAQLADQAKLIGLDLPGDLEKLLGDQLTASLSGDDLARQPQWVVAATSQDPAAGKAVLDKLLAVAGASGASEPPFTAKVQGDSLYVGASSAAIAGATSTSSAASLTGDEMFQAAVADPGHAQSLVYVDLSKVWTLAKAAGASLPPELEHLKAVGMSSTTDGTSSDSTLRLVIR